MYDVEKRKYSRCQFIRDLQFTMADDPSGIFMCVVMNMGDGGMGIYTFTPLSPGQVIAAIDPSPIRSKAVVRWSEGITKGFYRAGLAFLSESQ